MSRARDLANGITTLAPLASPVFTGTPDFSGVSAFTHKADMINGNAVAGGEIGSAGVTTNFRGIIANSSLESTVTVPASVGSSLVLVKSVQNFAVNINNNTSNGYVSDCFNSTYRDYLVIITGQVGIYNAFLYARFGTDDTINSNTNYLFNIRSHDSLNNPYNRNGHATNYFALLDGTRGDGSNNFDRLAIKLLIHNPQAQYRTSWTGHSGHPRGGTAYFNSHTAGIFNGNDQFTDMSFYFVDIDTSGNQTGTFNFQSYGIKTS